MFFGVGVFGVEIGVVDFVLCLVVGVGWVYVLCVDVFVGFDGLVYWCV